MLSTACAQKGFTLTQGAVVRGDSTKKELALVFSADETGEGLKTIRKTLRRKNAKASFFFTGRFYRNAAFKKEIAKLVNEGHYLGPHSDQHLLYCDWNKRDSLLVSKDSFQHDIVQNLAALPKTTTALSTYQYFMPPYEWWNDSIARWSDEQGLTLLNFTPGIRTNSDYTWPELGTVYKSSEWILNWLKETLTVRPNTFNGSIVLIHAGTDARRKDKLYRQLSTIIDLFRDHGFKLKRIDELLSNDKAPDESSSSGAL